MRGRDEHPNTNIRYLLYVSVLEHLCIIIYNLGIRTDAHMAKTTSLSMVEGSSNDEECGATTTRTR